MGSPPQFDADNPPRRVGASRSSVLADKLQELRSSSLSARCLYDVLGLSPNSGVAQIRSAYRLRVLETHPDKTGGTAEAFQEVVEAFELLSDVARRRIYDEERSQPSGEGVVPQSTISTSSLAAKLATVLRRMSAATRNYALASKLTETQRAELMQHMLAERKCQRTFASMSEHSFDSTGGASSSVRVSSMRVQGATAVLSIRDGAVLGCAESFPSFDRQADDFEVHEGHSGITKRPNSRGTFGYCAKVWLKGLCLIGRVRKELFQAVHDHIALLWVVEQIRAGTPYNRFALHMRQAIADVLSDPRDIDDLVSCVRISVSCHHFIGSRQLQLHRRTLHDGLNAWEKLREAKGPVLFRGHGVTDDYSPDAALDQWQRIKQTYLDLECDVGSSRSCLEDRLLLWEKNQEPMRLRKDCDIWRRKNLKSGRTRPQPVVDVELIRRLDMLLKQARTTAHRKLSLAGRASRSALDRDSPSRPRRGAKRRRESDLLLSQTSGLACETVEKSRRNRASSFFASTGMPGILFNPLHAC